MNRTVSYARHLLALIIVFALTPFAHSQWKPGNPVTGVQRQADEVLFAQQQGFRRLQVCSDSIKQQGVGIRDEESFDRLVHYIGQPMTIVA
jgi:hypothetical protein